MPKLDQRDEITIVDLYKELSDTSKKQAETLGVLARTAVETKLILQGQIEKQEVHAKTLWKHDERLRAVERKHDMCTAGDEIRGIKKQLNRLAAFKDMILSKNSEDSTVIDVHAQRMKHAVEAAMSQSLPPKVFAWKMFPWLIVVFVVGVALASILTYKMVLGDTSVHLPNLGQVSPPKSE